MRGETRYIFLCKLFKLTEGSLKRQNLSHLVWFRLISIWPICTHICIKSFIRLTDIPFLTNLSSKLSSSLLSKLEKFSESSWHNPRHFEEHKAVDYRSCIPLLLLSTFILRHCHQTLKEYVCSSVQYMKTICRLMFFNDSLDIVVSALLF